MVNACLLQAQYTAIPDSGFEQTLINQGIDSQGVLDGQVLTSDIDAITELDLFNYAGDGIVIFDLTGIEDFTALEVLNCAGQSLSQLHLNNNFALRELNCSMNTSLSDIDISQNVNLESLDCSLTGDFAGGINIDFSNNINLKYLTAVNASLNGIDLSNNINLKELYLYNDIYDDFGYENDIVTLDLSNNTQLEILECSNTNLQTIVLPNTNTLTHVSLFMQNLSTIDLSQNPELEYLDLSLNYNLSTLDVTNNHNLIRLDVNKCNLTQLDVSQNPQLERLYLGYFWTDNSGQEPPYNNDIQNIDISNNPALKWLQLRNINLNALDVSSNINLLTLFAGKNNIQMLDLSNNTQLTWLTVDENPLQELDLSNNTALEYVSCMNTNMNALNLKNGNNQILDFVFATGNLYLNCIEVDNAVDANNQTGYYVHWQKDPWAVFSENCASSSFEEDLLQNIELYPNPTSGMLFIRNKSNAKILSVKVYNSLGKEILKIENNFNKINLSTLNSGLYFIKIETKTGVVTQSLLIKQT